MEKPKKVALRPVLIMIRGLPGSGKSYVARELQKQLDAGALVILDPDATDYDSQAYKDFSAALTAEGVDAKLHPYRFLRSRGYAAILEGKVIIWNQAFTHLDLLDRTIKNLQAYATEHGVELPAFVVEVEVELKVAKQRVHERAAAGGHDVTDEVFERFINDYKSFDGFGYDIVKVNGTADVAESASRIAAEITRLRV